MMKCSLLCDAIAKGVMVQKIHTQMDYFSVMRPQAVKGQSLFEALESGLRGLGIQEVSAKQCKKLVGISTDGASANIPVMWFQPHPLI